jgi:hypothetical protein
MLESLYILNINSMLKKLYVFLCAAGLSLFAVGTSFAFSDVSTATNYSEAIQDLFGRNIISGYPDGSFKPLNNVNRAELLKIAIEASKVMEYQTVALSNCFPDVTDQWFANYVCFAKQNNWVKGYPDGLFHPENDVNFAEASKIFLNVTKNSTAGTLNTQSQNDTIWYRPYIKLLSLNHYVPASITEVDQKLNRGEIAEITWRRNIINYSASLEGSYFEWDNNALTVKKYLGYSYYLYNNKIYYGNDELAGADAATFQKTGDEFCKDVNNVYFMGEIIQEADVNNFKSDSAYFWGKDGKIYMADAFLAEITVVDGADPLTFHTYTGADNEARYFIATDKDYVYNFGKKVEGSDGPTFEILDETVRTLQDGMNKYAKDKNQVYLLLYWEGVSMRIAPDVDISTFSIVADRIYKDKDNVYIWGEIIPDLDPAQFEYIGRLEESLYSFIDFFRYNDAIYFYGRIPDKSHTEGINGEMPAIFEVADAETFMIIDTLNAQDKNFDYSLEDGSFPTFLPV